jgi:ribonuclease HI
MNQDALHVDGGFIVNKLIFDIHKPRGQGYAKINYDKDNRQEIYLPSQDNTNQETELFALLCGLTECIRLGKKHIVTDSEWAMHMAKGDYKPKDDRFKLITYALQSLLKFYKIEITWINREQNYAT